ncbi:MAG: DUF4336 domain-containing protein [Nannocystaceae bacterium]
MHAFGEGIWTVAAPLKFRGIQVNTRMTVCQLADGGLAVIGPVQYSKELAACVDLIGEVRAILAPNLMHHLYVGDWIDAYPGARSFAAEGIGAKRPELSFSATLGPDYDEFCGEELERITIAGMPKLNESLFVHHRSHTLIATDFCFHLPDARGFAALFAMLTGVKRGVRVEPLFKAWIKDTQAFRESLRPLRGLNIEHLTMCHHAVVSEGATAILNDVLDQVGVPR